MKKIYVPILIVLSLMLVSCEANPTFEGLAYAMYLQSDSYNDTTNTYYIAVSKIPQDPIEIDYMLYCNSGGMFVEGEYYFQARENYLFTYEISKDDVIIESKEMDDEAPFEQVMFPNQGSNAPKAAIYSEAPLSVLLDGVGTYKVVINAHTFYNQVWRHFSITVTIVVTE